MDGILEKAEAEVKKLGEDEALLSAEKLKLHEIRDHLGEIRHSLNGIRIVVQRKEIDQLASFTEISANRAREATKELFNIPSKEDVAWLVQHFILNGKPSRTMNFVDEFQDKNKIHISNLLDKQLVVQMEDEFILTARGFKYLENYYRHPVRWLYTHKIDLLMGALGFIVAVILEKLVGQILDKLPAFWNDGFQVLGLVNNFLAS